MQNVNVVCVNWGDKYAPEYVTRLHAMVARNTTKDFKIIALPTGLMPTKPIVPIQLPTGLEGWWNKMLLFKPGVLPEENICILI